MAAPVVAETCPKCVRKTFTRLIGHRIEIATGKLARDHRADAGWHSNSLPHGISGCDPKLANRDGQPYIRNKRHMRDVCKMNGLTYDD